MKQLKIKKLTSDAKLPTRAYSTDCGLDIYSNETSIVEPGEGKVFSTGVAGEFEPGYLGMLTDRSSMAKKGFKLAGGVIDPHFCGELSVVLRNLTRQPMLVSKGDRIAQLLIIPISIPEVVEVDELTSNGRGINSFGSSGA